MVISLLQLKTMLNTLVIFHQKEQKDGLALLHWKLLSIIAYKQPITKPELESIRGVNSDHIISSLLEKYLIAITGRAETVGRPLLYGTTDEFLKYFGLNNLTDLPKPREIEEIMEDDDFIEQKRKIMMNALEENLDEEVKEQEENNGEDQ